MPDTDQSLPPYAVLARHTVADFDTWKAGFDDHEDARRSAGILGHHLNRAENDPNLITIYMAVQDLDAAKAFTSSDDLKQIMAEVGVTAPPEFTWLKPVSEAIVWDRELPAFLLRHSVADFDEWLKGYRGADQFRSSHSIIGHAANQSLDDPSVAVVYHQAESFDTLRSFLADPDLQALMKEAGVTSEPDVSFETGGWAKMY